MVLGECVHMYQSSLVTFTDVCLSVTPIRRVGDRGSKRTSTWKSNIARHSIKALENAICGSFAVLCQLICNHIYRLFLLRALRSVFRLTANEFRSNHSICPTKRAPSTLPHHVCRSLDFSPPLSQLPSRSCFACRSQVAVAASRRPGTPSACWRTPQTPPGASTQPPPVEFQWRRRCPRPCWKGSARGQWSSPAGGLW